jgi:hypothetical protein
MSKISMISMISTIGVSQGLIIESFDEMSDRNGSWPNVYSFTHG